MKQIESAVRDIAYLDSVAERRTWAYRLDPRAKAIVTLALIITVASFPQHAVGELLPYAAYPLILILGGRVPVRVLRRPLWIALMFALLIGIANPFLDREPVQIGSDWTIAGGWISFASILLRSVLCVVTAMTLVATTGMERLCHGLARLGVPRILVSQILFLYRYIFLLGENAIAVSRARALRSCGHTLGLGTYGSLIGNLLLRTFDRAERIYRAMQCRGFHGEIPIGKRLRFGWIDRFFLMGWCFLFLLMRLYPVTERIGTVLIEWW